MKAQTRDMTAEARSLGRFRLQGLLGRSPSHLVRLAQDGPGGRLVTVTTGCPGVLPRVAKEHFQREWEISRRLSHPGIQKVLELGDDPSLGPFLVKEYAPGVVLSVLLTERIPRDAGLHLLVQLLRALQATVEAGVVHGDVKPENIVVDFHGRLVLMDFHAGVQSDSKEGPRYASPGYAAPEVIRGERPSSRSDLFSFAVTAFQILTGAMPFSGADPPAILRATCENPPVFPAGMSIATRMVFLSALEKDPEARWTDLGSFMTSLIRSLSLPEDFAKALFGFLEGRPLEIRGLAPLLAKHAPSPEPSVVESPCATRPLKGGGRILSGLKVAVGLTALSLSGFLAWRFSGSSAKTTVPIAAPAPVRPKPRLVQVATIPAGAQVILDGELQGRSPLEALALSGDRTHQVTVQLAGYREWKRDLGPADSLPDPIRLEADAPPVPPKPASKAPKKPKAFDLYEHLRRQEGR